MANWLFDGHGTARLFLHDDRFISKDGKNLGWLVGENVYSLNGKHLGWFEEGVLYDGQNRAIAFERGARGHLPSRPGIGGIPGTPGIPGRPGRPGLSGVPGKPGRGGWSNLDVEQFFTESD